MADKKTYIVFNSDTCYSTAIKLTEEQVKTLKWFIDFANLDFSVCLPEEVASEVE